MQHSEQVIVVSDLHAACKLALCPREGVQLDEGGIYRPSPLQLKLDDWWEEFWCEWVPHETHGAPWDLVVNGDAIDGVHHKSTTQITHNTEDQARIAEEMLQTPVDLCHASGGQYFHVRGTEAHVGPSGQDEERVARNLGAVHRNGQYARHELYLQVGEKKAGGGIVHFAHHIGTTGSQHYESSAPMREMAEAFVEAGRWGDEPPRGIVRSHRHRGIQIRIPSAMGESWVLVTPAWQLKTPYAYRIPGGRQRQPQIGGALIRLQGGELYPRLKTWRIERPEVD
jgi:hypothetical protein